MTRQVAAQQCACWNVGRTQAGSQQRQADGEIAVLLDGDGAWDTLLGGAPVAVRQSLADVAHPGGTDLFDAARPDQLVKEDIGNWADQVQVLSSLADDLVSCREWDERFQG